MTDLISYEELRKIQNAERDNRALQDLGENFFDNVREYIKSKENIIKENKTKDNTFARQTYEKAQQELNNINKILGDICARRQRKIILQAITNVTAKVHNTEQMFPEEEEVYNKILKLLIESKDVFFNKFEKTQESENLEKGTENLVVVRFTDDVPSFAWTDNQNYGPFDKEDISNLPKDVGEILIKQGKAIEIVVGEE